MWFLTALVAILRTKGVPRNMWRTLRGISARRFELRETCNIKELRTYYAAQSLTDPHAPDIEA